MPTASHHTVPSTPGLHEVSTGLRHLRFALARANPAGEAITLRTEDHEALIVVIDAPAGASITVAGRDFSLPPRRSVFTDEPSAVYAPPQTDVRVSGAALSGIFLSPVDHGQSAPQAYAILPDEVTTVERGRDNFARRVRDILPAARPAVRMLAGETLNAPGNWSSSPPHKHDRDIPGEEAELEEIYLYRLEPAQGFGLQLSYLADPPHEVAYAVRDLDVISIPAGYHPVVAAPGYQLYYLWCLAGHGRELLWKPDPAHAWIEGS